MNKDKLIRNLKAFAVGSAIGAFVGQLWVNHELKKEVDELDGITKASIKQTEDALDLAENYENLYEEREAYDTELIGKAKELIEFFNDAEGKES